MTSRNLDDAMAAAETTEESDADLLQLISWRAEYPDEARASFEAFHARHAKFLYGACLKRFGDKLPTYMTVEDLVGDTFVRVLERAGTFSAGGETDPTALRRLTRGWLLAIAHNVLNDAFRDRLTLEESRDGEFFEEWEFVEPPEDSPRVRLVDRAYCEALDERERDVLAVPPKVLEHPSVIKHSGFRFPLPLLDAESVLSW